MGSTQIIQIPIIETIKNYKRSFFRIDLFAGVTVATIAIPQAMAYAQLAGAPIAMGLYATLISMLVFALFSKTKRVIVGPDAAIAALTGATLIPLANGSTAHYVALVALLAILIGIASLVAVLSKLGFLGEFLSRPILLGYMAGLALTVIASQSPKLFGITGFTGANFFGSVFYTITNLGNAHIKTILLSLGLIFTYYILVKFLPKIPVILVLLIGSIIISWIVDFSGAGIAIVGTIPPGLPLPSIPNVNYSDVQNLFIPAFAIMMISYANTIATARTFASKKAHPVDSAQELSALGLANIGAGIFGGIPVAASGSRTAVNAQNKAASQVSQLFAAVVVGLALLLLTPILKFLPLAALAVIIIVAVLRLFNLAELKSIWHAWRSEAILAIVTVLGVAFLGIFQGLLLAIFLAVANLLRKSVFPGDAVMGIAADGSIRDSKRPPKTEAIPGIIIYRFDAPLYFGNTNYFRQRVLQLIDETPDTRWFLWDAETITSLDSTAGAMLLDLIKELKTRKITFCVSRMKGPIRSIINKTNRLSKAFKTIEYYSSMGHALVAFKEEIALKENKKIIIPSKNYDIHKTSESAKKLLK